MFSRLFKNFGRSDDSSLISYKTAQHNSPEDYRSLSDLGYKQNVIVYRSINLIARAVSSVAWILKKVQKNQTVDEIIYDHPLLSLLNRPNLMQSKPLFIESMISHLLLDGNCYILKSSNGKETQLYLLRPDRVRIVPGLGALPAGFEYSVDNHRRFFEVNQETGESDILHIKLFNPLDDWYGLSPVEVCLSSIRQHNAIVVQNTAFLQNGGRPSGALMYKDSLSRDRREELKRDLRNLYEGERNAGKLLLLEGNFEWREMGLSPKDLDFIAGKELSAKEIALSFGVPPILIGIMSAATFANYREARYNFWEETILPLLNIIAQSISAWFKIQFKTDLTLEFDIDSIPALSKRREAEWDKINNASFLTDNEKREVFGYRAHEEEKQ